MLESFEFATFLFQLLSSKKTRLPASRSLEVDEILARLGDEDESTEAPTIVCSPWGCSTAGVKTPRKKPSDLWVRWHPIHSIHPIWWNLPPRQEGDWIWKLQRNNFLLEQWPECSKMQLGKNGWDYNEINCDDFHWDFDFWKVLEWISHLADTSLRCFSMVQAPVCGAEPWFATGQP